MARCEGVWAGRAEELDQVIRDVQDKGVSKDEITEAVKQLTVQEVDSARTPDGMAQLVGTVQTIFNDPSLYSDDLKKYMKVTATMPTMPMEEILMEWVRSGGTPVNLKFAAAMPV